MKHVLVPLDGSLLGESALVQAEEVVEMGGMITLMTAVETPEIPMYGFDVVGVATAPSYQALLEEVMMRARAYLDKVGEKLRSKGYRTQAIVQFSEPATLIVECADRLAVDSIVMSTHGRSGISRWLFGSVTSRVLTLASCPVLVVPSEMGPRPVLPDFVQIVRSPTTGQRLV